MSDTLYRKDLLRLAADATGAGYLPSAHASATVHNPACGDRVTVDIAMDAGRIAALAHSTSACVLTQASASLLGAGAAGLDRAAIADLAQGVRAMLAGASPPPAPFDGYGAFEGATELKARHKCVLLPLEAALEALDLLEPSKPGA